MSYIKYILITLSIWIGVGLCFALIHDDAAPKGKKLTWKGIFLFSLFWPLMLMNGI